MNMDKQSTLTSFFNAKPKTIPIGGWSESPQLSGVELGKPVPNSGINHNTKTTLVDQHIQSVIGSQSADLADVAINQSRENAKRETPGQFQVGLNNEAFETLRLKRAGRQGVIASQSEITFRDRDRGQVTRKPDLLQYDYPLQEFRFGEIKTKSVEDAQQIPDMAGRTPISFPDNTSAVVTGVDVAFSNSSTQLDPSMLSGFDAFNQEKGARSIRVRSNSMSEGAFISPAEMLLRQEQRKTITSP